MADMQTVEPSPAVLEGAEKRKHLVRAVAASAIGTTIEWYDYFL
jgi:hypothetical protein